MNYQWITFVAARQQLAQRLYDTLEVWTTDAEAGIYIQQALRMFNALTATWKTDYTFNPTTLWTSLGTAPNSPRLRTLTDTFCYTLMEYMLVEPPTGGTWTGTPQFSISDLAQALQKRRDEILQISNCNQVLMPNIPLTPGTRRTVLPDNVIEVARVRYLPGGSPTIGYGEGGYGGGGYGGHTGSATPGAVTLYRDDTVALEYYEPDFWQAQPGTPNTFMLTSEPPLSWDVDIPPSQPGIYEAVTLQSGQAFNPPTGTLLNIPDDFAWVAIWGALSDLLGRESEAVDRQRADFCLKRYLDGIKLLLKSPWIMLAKVTGVAVTTESIYAADRYSPEWDSNPTTFGFIVTGGLDFFAAPLGTSIGLTVLGNAPIPVLDTDYVQVSRSNWDTVLDLAQYLACFKLGGEEFQAALELEARAIQACAAENTRLKSTGAFADILIQRSQMQEADQERFATAQAAPRKQR